ncbi:thioesterase II family protein [Anaerosporobacter sp.]
MNKVKVFLIPYAGATSYAYYRCKKLFPEELSPVFLELAGRGSRGEETFYKSISSAGEDIAKNIIDYTRDCDYIIFGHSMGALIAYEAYYKLMEFNWKKPLHIFISGQRPPHLIRRDTLIPQYSDETFLRIVSEYGGLTDEFYNDKIQSIFLPILRADFRILGEYQCMEKNEKVMCDMTILYGDEDQNIEENEITYWSEYAGQNMDFYKFNGEHFFIWDHFQEIICLMQKAIVKTVLR